MNGIKTKKPWKRRLKKLIVLLVVLGLAAGAGQSQILCKLQMRHEQSRIIHCARQRIYPTAALCAV